MYSPIVAMDVAAAKATEEPSEGRARQKERNEASQTVRIGERKRLSTLWKKFGWITVSQPLFSVIRSLDMVA